MLDGESRLYKRSTFAAVSDDFSALEQYPENTEDREGHRGKRRDMVRSGNLGRMTLGMRDRLGFPPGVNYTCGKMPKSSKPKSAFDALVESVCNLRAEAKERMTEEEFRHAEEKLHELANKVRASRGRKRETA